MTFLTENEFRNKKLYEYLKNEHVFCKIHPSENTDYNLNMKNIIGIHYNCNKFIENLNKIDENVKIKEVFYVRIFLEDIIIVSEMPYFKDYLKIFRVYKEDKKFYNITLFRSNKIVCTFRLYEYPHITSCSFNYFDYDTKYIKLTSSYYYDIYDNNVIYNSSGYFSCNSIGCRKLLLM